MYSSVARIRGKVVRTAKSRQRWYRILELSAEGATKREAAAAVGLTVDGMNTLIRKHVGNIRWPITQEQSA